MKSDEASLKVRKCPDLIWAGFPSAIDDVEVEEEEEEEDEEDEEDA